MMVKASASVGCDVLIVDGPDLSRPSDQLPLVADRLYEILSIGSGFDVIHRQILAAPGKRIRAGIALVCARLRPSAHAAPLRDAVDVACAMEMFHEASLIADLRTIAPAQCTVRTRRVWRPQRRSGGISSGRQGFRSTRAILADHPAVFARLGEMPGITYLDRISDLSAGQIVECLPSAVDDAMRTPTTQFQLETLDTAGEGGRT